MLILRHLLGVIGFSAVFMLGMIMARRDQSWASALLHRSNPSLMACKFFHISGRCLQCIATIGVFLDLVAILVLLTGWITEILIVGF